jgi:hypothetical protein
MTEEQNCESLDKQYNNFIFRRKNSSLYLKVLDNKRTLLN